MKNLPSTIHIMTAGLTPGDAISNFIISSGRILREQGARVYLYADHIAPQYGSIARHSRFYPNSGKDILWFHYSIYADNVEIALTSNDYKIMDFHGICPPRLFTGQNEHLKFLCQQGYDVLPSLKGKFDNYVVHTEYSRNWLQSLHFPKDQITKIFFCIDTSAFVGEDSELGGLLSKLDYFLFVGRIVPQKDVLALIEIFSFINQQMPETVLILVGSRNQAGKYQQQIEKLIALKGLQNRIMFTGQVNNPAVLEALFRHARLLIVTSEWESFCVPIAESLHFGVPTAVHHEPPMPEVAGPAGLIFDKANPEAAAGHVLDLLNDEVRYQQLKQAASEWSAQYSDTALAESIKNLFAQIKQPHY